MTALPVVVGFGGVNAAGRSTLHLGYCRMVHESLGDQDRHTMFDALAALTNTDRDAFTTPAAFEQYLLLNSLIRPIGLEHFDTQAAPGYKRVAMSSDAPAEFVIKKRDLPSVIPEHWDIDDEGGNKVTVRSNQLEAFIPHTRKMAVSAAGTVPTGFDPAKEYSSRHHPRGLQLNTFAASDALQSMGIEWTSVMSHIAPDEVSVYSGSAMAQLDQAGGGGMLRARWQSDRPSSKQCPLSLIEMPADFVNAYLLGSVGSTGAAVGACASFLYNLKLAIDDITAGRAKVAFVGNAEAPVSPEVMEGYAAMSALATDDGVAKLDNTEQPDLRKTSRPFGDNCGFTIAESAQYIVLMADDLAIELGATIHASTPEVYVNADGFKKSISAPGMGNYVTMAKAVGYARALLGQESVARHSMVQAHGSSTPANRVTESLIFDRVAKAFGINEWPITAVKSYLGHTLGVASGDQLVATLGIWEYGIIPRINNVDQVAADVHQDNLSFVTEHRDVGVDAIDCAFLNAKGFGGNNATGVLVSPHKTVELLAKRYSQADWDSYQKRNAEVQKNVAQFKAQLVDGSAMTQYHFGTGVVEDEGVQFDGEQMSIEGFATDVDLNIATAYEDMI